MKLTKTLAALAIAALGVFSTVAPAAVTITTGADATSSTEAGPAGSAGDTFSLPAGTFTSYVGTPGSPTNSGDLEYFRYSLNGTINNVAGLAFDISGTYKVFYDQNLDSIDNDGLQVSAGNFAFSALAAPVPPYLSAVTGTFTQTAGPSNPAFADFGAIFTNLNYTGTYTPSLTTANSGTLAGVLTAVPEPTTLAALGGASVLGLRRRRA